LWNESFFSAPQLKRDSLDGATYAMTIIIRWLSRVFVLAAAGLLVLVRLRDHYPGDTISSPVWILFLVSVVTLPAAAVQAYRDDDPRSRRNWLLMLAILGVLLVAAILMKPVR